MAGRRKGAGEPRETPIEALRHKDTRKNIPTREQDELVADEEQAPETMLYPRDPTLDPQLVWKGKDEQDRQALEVPIVPIYIQETIKPQALVEDLRARAKGAKPQLDLFGDLQMQRDIEEQIEFYEHEDQWRNRMILGDSLVVMTSLAQKEGLKGKVQMIYFDPPYGIDFGSNWQVSTRNRTVKDGRPENLTRQPEQIQAFRDTWKLGIHSYLSYLRDRVAVAYELLTDSGSLFVQIGDENLHLVRNILDEIFGPRNAHPIIVFRKKMMPMMKEAGFESVCDFILWYQKNKDDSVKGLRRLFVEKSTEGDTAWNWAELPDGERTKLTAEQVAAPRSLLSGAKVFQPISLLPREYRANQDFPFEFEGTTYRPPKGLCWSTHQPGMSRLAAARRLHKSGEEGLRYVYFHEDYPVARVTAVWMDAAPATDMRYVVETNINVIQRLMIACTKPGDLVLDPTCGGGTTAYVAELWGRRWITCDTSRVAIALARARIMSAQYRYYLLRDSIEGQKKETEALGMPPSGDRFESDIRKEFVYRRVPHVVLGAIANNEEIDAILARHGEELNKARAKLNNSIKMSWRDWEVPRDVDLSWPVQAKAAHVDYWQIRRARQKEIDASIARRAEYEILYDQPYEDPKRIRVAGPFTVESLSPHRTIAPSSNPARAAERSATFVTTILENIKKAGVQNTIKNERLHLDRVTPYASRSGWIHAEGEFADKSGELRRVAISIGPEHGTVSPVQVRGAAKEALKHFHLLVVCGFAFDALAYEAAREFAPFPLMLARMNPDLAMGDELLKKTGAANLFMVFGEPDITLQKSRDGKLSVEIKGLDIYNPTTGEIHNHTTDEIACWFVDTDYNGDCFFVRQAYFTGATDPYEKLKRALKAEIDEATWESVRGTKSRPFDPPSTGMIAVKVINHYGDEVLKVYKTS